MRNRLAMVPFVLLLASILPADTVSIGASADNTLYEDGAGALSNGVGVGFFAGKNSSALMRRGLVRFDIAGSIPAGATITSVQLALNMSNTAGGTSIVALHRCNAAWGEGTSNATMGGGGGGAASTTGDATWIHRSFSTVLWTLPGGDFAAVESASVSITAVGPYTWTTTAAMVSDVQGWLDTPSTNAGWVVRGDEVLNGTVKRFDSRENTTPANRPSLTVNYTPSAAVGDWTLFQ